MLLGRCGAQQYQQRQRQQISGAIRYGGRTVELVVLKTPVSILYPMSISLKF